MKMEWSPGICLVKANLETLKLIVRSVGLLRVPPSRAARLVRVPRWVPCGQGGHDTN